MDGDGETQPDIHPARIQPDRHIDEIADLENSMMSSTLRLISRRDMPISAPFKKMLSRPDNSGWKPAPSSSSAVTRPSTVTRPEVASMILEISLSEVLLPEPLGPITPTVAPRGTSKLTFFSAQNSSRSRHHGCAPNAATSAPE
jgi:hypothetical protein